MNNKYSGKYRRIFSTTALLTSLTVCSASLLMTGCATPKLSDSLYRSSEVGLSKTTVRCRVLAVREVLLRNDQADAEGSGMFGSIVGGIMGATLGSQIGSGLTNSLATQGIAAAGVVGGDILGTKLGDKMSERVGVEYSVILGNGQERTLVQEVLPSDRMLAINETCRLQMSYDGKNRVLAAENLPTEVYAPKTTNLIPLPR